jgi:hypothetical protein
MAPIPNQPSAPGLMRTAPRRYRHEGSRRTGVKFQLKGDLLCRELR